MIRRSKTNETNWPLHDKEEAEQLVKEKNIQVMEDAGRGYRQVVASLNKNIVELLTIQTLVDAGQTVIAGGGGGISHSRRNRLKG